MTNQDFYTTLTIGTDLIPSEDIYYKKLGAILYEMRIKQGLAIPQVCYATGIKTDDLYGYENGAQKIPVYDLLLLLSFMEQE